MVEKFRLFEQGASDDEINEVGFAKVATIDEIRKIRKNGYVLTPGIYVGIKIEDDSVPFEKKMEEYSKELSKLLEEEKELPAKVKEVFKSLGFEMRE